MQIELDDDRLGGARIEETLWGYTLHGAGADSALLKAARVLASFMGVLCIFCSIGLWVLPGTLFTGELLPLKLAISTFAFLLGCFFVQLSHEGGRTEVQVDHERRELRAVERIEGSAGKLLAIWPFDEIGSVDVSDGRFLVLDRNEGLLADLRLGRARRAGRALQVDQACA